MSRPRVLVTRPEKAAVETARRIRALGMDPVVLPVSRVSIDADRIAAALSEPLSALAFTSANAVCAVAQCRGAVEMWRDKPVFAVGERTSRGALQAGFKDVRTASGRHTGTGDMLAAAIIAEAEAIGVSGRLPLCYVAGTPRTPIFEAALEQAGLPWRVIECYRTAQAEYSAEEMRTVVPSGSIDAVVLYSRRSVARLAALLDRHGLADRLDRATIVCLSERIANVVPENLGAEIVYAERAVEDSLLERLATIRADRP